ncbi:MAG: pyroglutamyl-peptidase I [Bacteroidales bacterium]|nr:pyroglutamyl-peptidase I [Bacteroidales bacterium]
MKLLLTGFEPFGQESVNPSWEAVKAIPDMVEGMEVIKVRLPVTFKGAAVMLEQAVDEFRPDVVLCVGQGSGRSEVNIERVAINMADSKKPDNDGYQPEEMPVRAEAPDAYFSNLPVKRLVEALHDAGVPAVVSNSAGAYVCNSVFYTAMHLVHNKYPDMRAGFVHIPYLPCQVVEKSKQPSMATETVVLALETILHTLATVNHV